MANEKGGGQKPPGIDRPEWHFDCALCDRDGWRTLYDVTTGRSRRVRCPEWTGPREDLRRKQLARRK